MDRTMRRVSSYDKLFEKRIPFHLFVQPSGAQISSFLQFEQLPTEIQFYILTFCSAPTLFQIMRVSSVLRMEAAKLFWEDPNTYYLVESTWLFYDSHPGNLQHEQYFFSHIQNVEINYAAFDDHAMTIRKPDALQKFIRDIWNTLRKMFPRAKRVIVCQNWMVREQTKHISFISTWLRSLIQACPPDIEVSACVLEVGTPVSENCTVPLPPKIGKKSLYKPVLDDGWTMVTPYVCWSTVSMPMKDSTVPSASWRGLVV